MVPRRSPWDGRTTAPYRVPGDNRRTEMNVDANLFMTASNSAICRFALLNMQQVTYVIGNEVIQQVRFPGGRGG